MPEPFQLEHFLPYLLNQAAETSSRAFQQVYKDRYGLLRNDWRVLFHLGLYGRLTARDISLRARLHKTKISRAVVRLEQRRYLTRRRDESDRRSEWLELTTQGGQVYRDLSDVAARYDARLADRLEGRGRGRITTCPAALGGRAEMTRDLELATWIAEQACRNDQREAFLERYCEKLVEMGLPLARLHVTQSALHPRYGAMGFSWNRGAEIDLSNYEIVESPLERWLKSPMYYLLAHQIRDLRLNFARDPDYRDFPMLIELQEAGITDYLATKTILEDGDSVDVVDPDNPPAGLLASWSTDAKEGWSEADLATIRATLPFLALALKSGANRRTLQDLMSIYLGAGPGARVVSGEIRRGTLEQIDAAILFFDLTGFTRMTEEHPGADVIALLNAYYGEVVAIISEHGGQVLKFMGDGLLAIFSSGDAKADARASLAVARALEPAVSDLSKARADRGETTTDYTLALHSGNLFYGNIGAEDRLDFTVIGAAVNQTARLSGMHRPLGQKVVISEAIKTAAGANDLVGLGRYMLRGVAHPQSLYTIYAPAT